MLTDNQAADLWEEMIAAEVRSLYFGELGSRYSKWNAIISGASFFLSSSAAAAIVAKSNPWVPIILSLVTAVATAYSIAVGLQKRSMTMTKLYSAWSQIESECRILWNHWYEEDAEDRFENILTRIRQASELAITDAPYDTNLLKKWRSYVHMEHGLALA